MRKIPKAVKWGVPIVVLLLIGLALFPLFPKAFFFKSDSGFHPTDAQYQALLGKFSNKFLNDFVPHWLPPTSLSSTESARTLRDLRNMTEPSVARLVTTRYEDPYRWEDPWTWERQEVRQVDAILARGKVDQQVAKDYTPAIDKPLFDQFVDQRLPALGKEQLDTWLTNAILLATHDPTYDLASVVDPAHYGGDMTYHGGPVIDGIVNIYLIFWIDASFQPASPKYGSLIEQFVQDIGQSPLYANLSQYHDSSGRYPTGARLAGTFTDTRPFPQDLVAARDASSYDQSNESFPSIKWRQEIQQVAASQNWNAQDYHNLFILLPTMNWACGFHDNLSRYGSPWAYISYPYFKGQEQCMDATQSPNHDHIADVAIDTLSHEIMEAVSDPYLNGWYGGDISQPEGGEMGDKCPLPDATVDPKTNGNVTWNGHTYLIQEEYDNVRHGCILAGP